MQSNQLSHERQAGQLELQPEGWRTGAKDPETATARGSISICNGGQAVDRLSTAGLSCSATTSASLC
jgi:hypothetical protein